MRIPPKFCSLTTDINNFKNIFDLLDIGETNSPSTTIKENPMVVEGESNGSKRRIQW
jgi:hypothetical protein